MIQQKQQHLWNGRTLSRAPFYTLRDTPPAGYETAAARGPSP